MKRIKAEKVTGLVEVSLGGNIDMYGLDTPISNFFFRRKVFTTRSLDEKKFALVNTHRNIGPGKVNLKFKEV